MLLRSLRASLYTPSFNILLHTLLYTLLQLILLQINGGELLISNVADDNFGCVVQSDFKIIH